MDGWLSLGRASARIGPVDASLGLTAPLRIQFVGALFVAEGILVLLTFATLFRKLPRELFGGGVAIEVQPLVALCGLLPLLALPVVTWWTGRAATDELRVGRGRREDRVGSACLG